jgi:hypothetical protein
MGGPCDRLERDGKPHAPERQKIVAARGEITGARNEASEARVPATKLDAALDNVMLSV